LRYIFLKVQGSGFKVQGSGFRVQGSRFRVQGLSIIDFGLKNMPMLYAFHYPFPDT